MQAVEAWGWDVSPLKFSVMGNPPSKEEEKQKRDKIKKTQEKNKNCPQVIKN